LTTTEQLYRVDYEIQVTHVARNAPGPHAPLVDKVEIGKRPILRVQDDLAMFEFQVFDAHFDVRLTNKTRRSTGEQFTFLLDRAEFIDPQGQSHALVFFYSIGNPGKRVPPGKHRTFQLAPSGYKERRGTLFGPPTVGRVAPTPEEIQRLYAEQIGRTFRLRLPVQVGTRVYEYDFDMRVARTVPRVQPKERF
jgi:hypothetical protein